MHPGLIVGLLILTVAVTVIANWLVAGLRRPALPARLSLALLSAIVTNLVWMALIFAAGILATRYIERVDNALPGYLAFGLVALGLSVIRAWLYRRASSQPPTNPWPLILHTLGYGLCALVAYLLLVVVARGRVASPLLFIPLLVGALLPDLDSPASPAGRLLPFLSRWLEARLGQRGPGHTPAANVGLAVATAPLIPLIGPEGWGLLSLGFFCHLAVDLLSPQGIMLLWPWKQTRYRLAAFLESPGCVAERWFVAALAAVALILILAVDFGPPPRPPAPALSYEQSLERFYALRGRNLVLADVEGTWQATGRRVAARFEVLNAVGQSFILFDRYSGTVFSAGRAAADNFHLDRITLLAGSPVQIRPVEIRLRDEPLAGALPVLYQMQREPGLQHIFISGDVILPAGQGGALPVDYAQTRLRKVEAPAAGHYRLQYLTAAELIDLAAIQVEAADLVIVATYTSPASGPTATPLPPPPPAFSAVDRQKYSAFSAFSAVDYQRFSLPQG